MNQRTKTIFRYFFVVLLGVLLHFAYDLSGRTPLVGLFGLVNESVWEHLKLIFFPMLVLTLWDIFNRQRNNLCFLPARVSGIIIGMAFIIVSFYTVTGVLGFLRAWINILLYFLGVVVAFYAERKLINRCNTITIPISIALLFFFTILFLLFTIAPPNLGIFIPMQE